MSKKLPVLILVALCSACSASKETSLVGSILHEEESRRGEADHLVSDESTTRYLFMRGELAFQQENLGEAEEYFELAAKRDKDSPTYLSIRLAQLYLRSGKLNEALQQLDSIPQKTPQILELRAGILATLKRKPEAIAAYEELLTLQTDAVDEDAYILLSSLYAESNNIQAAISTLKTLIKKAPQSVFGYYYLARVSEAVGDLRGAEQSYRQALKLSPSAESIQLDLARCLGLQRKYAEAVTICESLIQSNPENLPARQLLGQLLLGSNQVDEALTQFERVGALEKDPTDTRLKIALIKFERKDYEGAETQLNLILAESPGNAAARYYLALVYAGLNRVNDALDQLKKITPDKKQFIESRLFAGFILRQEKRYEEAISLLREALKEKQDVRLLGMLASAQKDAGKSDEALVTTREMIALEPEVDAHYFNLGALHDELGERQQAILAMKKAIELNPNNQNALNYLAYVYTEDNINLDEAELLIKRALEIEPANGYFIDTLAWLYFQREDYQGALRELKRAIEVTPEDAVILEHLAKAYQKVGDIAAALETAQKAEKFEAESDDKKVAQRLDSLIEELKTQK